MWYIGLIITKNSNFPCDEQNIYCYISLLLIYQLSMVQILRWACQIQVGKDAVHKFSLAFSDNRFHRKVIGWLIVFSFFNDDNTVYYPHFFPFLEYQRLLILTRPLLLWWMSSHIQRYLADWISLLICYTGQCICIIIQMSTSYTRMLISNIQYPFDLLAWNSPLYWLNSERSEALGFTVFLFFLFSCLLL